MWPYQGYVQAWRDMLKIGSWDYLFMTRYEACIAIAELLKSVAVMNNLPYESPARANYARLLDSLFKIAL